MKKQLLILSAIALTQFFTACGSSESKPGDATGSETEAPVDVHYTVADFADLDLSANGINATMKAPKGATVKKSGDGSLVVQAGKYFQMHIKSNPESSAEEFVGFSREMASDKDMNSSFSKMAVDEEFGFISEKSNGELNFVWVVPQGDGCIVTGNGVPYADALDGYTDVPPPADLKVMWEAAKTITVK